MDFHFLSPNTIAFPPAELADEDGLLAVGGALTPDWLLAAYHQGIFPWFNEGEPPLWWCPDPRCVLIPEKLKISKSMKQLLRHPPFEFKIDTAFDEVVAACRQARRPGQYGTWITDEVAAGYGALHKLGYAHSAEAWQDGKLVGGLYGVKLRNVFFGESMFSRLSNSSKWAFTHWVAHLQTAGVQLIDCQIATDHLLSLGAEMMPRPRFLGLVKALSAS